MSNETNKMNLLQKIIEVRKLVEYLQKDTTGYKYKYVSGTSVLSAIRPKMDELGLILKTDVLNNCHEGSNVYVDLKMTWINAENPQEQLESLWFSAGEDADPAKAVGKMYTYGERYYLLKFFNIPTDELDPDKFQEKGAQKNVNVKAGETHAKISDEEFEQLKSLAINNGYTFDDVKAYCNTLGYDKVRNLNHADWEYTMLTFKTKKEDRSVIS